MDIEATRDTFYFAKSTGKIKARKDYIKQVPPETAAELAELAELALALAKNKALLNLIAF